MSKLVHFDTHYEASMHESYYGRGKAEGREEGREEGGEEKALQIARNLLLDGLKLESVAKNTGLDRETVKKIHASLTQPNE